MFHKTSAMSRATAEGAMVAPETHTAIFNVVDVFGELVFVCNAINIECKCKLVDERVVTGPKTNTLVTPLINVTI